MMRIILCDQERGEKLNTIININTTLGLLKKIETDLSTSIEMTTTMSEVLCDSCNCMMVLVLLRLK